MPVQPMLLHRMALVSFRLFCKNLGNLQEFFGQMVYRPPLAENCPYAYAYTLNVNENKWCDEIRRGRCYKLNLIKRLGRQKSLKPLKLTNGNSERERDGNSKLNAALSFPSGE